MGLIDKLQDILMPMREVEEEVDDAELERQAKKAKEYSVQTKTSSSIQMPQAMITRERLSQSEVPMRQVANGSPAYYQTGLSSFQNPKKSSSVKSSLAGQRGGDLSVDLCTPSNFDSMQQIADCLQKNRAVIVNLKNVHEMERSKIRYFMLGVCYALKGDVSNISSDIILYVPAGVDVKEYTSFDEE